MRPWLIAALAALAVLCACSGASDEGFRATDITGAQFARTLALTGHDGKPRTLADFKGKVTVVFFGFTHCPDVCPTTLAKFAEVAKRLEDDADRMQVLFVTVDPERDTPEVLSRYVPAFDPRFLGLYGDAEATARTAKEFKIVYQKQAGKTPESYTVDHSSGTFVFDREGHPRLYVRHDQPVDDLVHDLRLLLQG
jgi:protein SCO1/2